MLELSGEFHDRIHLQGASFLVALASSPGYDSTWGTWSGEFAGSMTRNPLRWLLVQEHLFFPSAQTLAVLVEVWLGLGPVLRLAGFLLGPSQPDLEEVTAHNPCEKLDYLGSFSEMCGREFSDLAK